MLRLTRRSEYGLMALAFMASQDGAYCSVREIVERLSIPRRLLAEVLKELSSAAIVEAVRGPGGGYRLRRGAEQISLTAVVEVLEGPVRVVECANGGHCGLEPLCTIREGLGEVAHGIQKVLDDYSLADLVRAGTPPAQPSLGV